LKRWLQPIPFVVAEIGALIVGSGYARIAAKPHLNHQLCLSGIYVYGPKHRGKGVNAILLKH
jgi:hypothetical protein